MTPRILTIDIETSPNIADVWGLYNQNIGITQLHDVTNVICWAAKWYGEKKVHFASDFHHGHDEQITRAHKLYDEADAVVTFNGTTFDVPHLRREWLIAGRQPPSPSLNIDLLRIVKSQFRFTSNKLQHVTTQLGMAGKFQHEGHGLWRRCMAGDPVAWATMRKYNVADVRQTEELYEKLRAWSPQSLHPNLNLYGGDGCPKCGSSELQRRGSQRSSTASYQRFQCQACGAWSRGKKAEQSINERAVT